MKDSPSPGPVQDTHATLEELEEARIRLAREESAREDAERAREEAERAKEEAERERADAERAREEAERSLTAIEARLKAAEGRARAVRAQVHAANQSTEGTGRTDLGNTLMNMSNNSGQIVDGDGRFSPDPFARMHGTHGNRVHGNASPEPMEDIHRKNPWIAAAARSAEEIRALQNPFVKPLDSTSPAGDAGDVKKKQVDNGITPGRKRKLSKRTKPPTTDGIAVP